MIHEKRCILREPGRMACVCMTVVLVTLAAGAQGQNIAGDLLAGNLIRPRVGQWAWYDLRDARGREQYVIRQAVVGRERVDRTTAYWLEFEIIPEIGFRTVFQVLLSGPARDPRNIHRIRMRHGADAVEEVPVERDALTPDTSRPQRRSVGMEDIATGSGIIRAEHLEIREEDRVLHLWTNDQVLPMGIVRMRTDEGEMVLRSHGVGGPYGESTLDDEGDSVASSPPEGNEEEDEPAEAPEEGEEG